MNARRVSVFLVVVAALVVLPSTVFGAVVTVSCTGTPATDGTALRTAYNGASGTASAPTVVQPDPCLYDLGNNTITLKNFVDLIGLGRNDTIITSQVDSSVTSNTGTITVPSNVDAEIANVTITNDDDSSTSCFGVYNSSSTLVMDSVIIAASCGEDATAVYTTASARINDSVLRATTTAEEVNGRVVGLEDAGGNSVVSDTLITFSGIACSDGFGVYLDDSAATLIGINIFGTCAEATGFEIREGSDAVINNSTVAVEGSINGYGIDLGGFFSVTTGAQVFDTRLDVASGSGTAYGVRVRRSSYSIRMTDVLAQIFTGSTQIGLQVSDGLAVADRSTFDAGTNSVVVAAAGTAKIGASKLSGTRSISGTATCVASYDGAYAAIGSSC